MKDKKVKEQSAKKIENAAIAGQQSVEKAIEAGQETVEKVANVARKTVEKAAKAGKESAEEVARAGADALGGGYDRYLELTREQLEKVLPEAVEKFDDFASFGKGTADAYFKAGDVAAKAFETLGDDVTAYHRKVWDDSIANTKALFGCKSFEDIIELQTSVARAQFENFVNDSAKLGELSLKTVNQALEPVGASVNAAIDRFSKPIAA